MQEFDLDTEENFEESSPPLIESESCFRVE